MQRVPASHQCLFRYSQVTDCINFNQRYGAEGARTPDLCNANAALSQLSYSPDASQPEPRRYSINRCQRTT